MLAGTYTGLVATAALLCLLQAGTNASIEGDGSSVTRTDAGTCTVHSNPHYSTFDGANFRFVGPCTYVLTRVCSPSAPSETPLSHFSVEVKNELRGNSSVSAVQQVKVEVENLRVSLHKRQNHRVMVNGIWRKLPLSLNGGTVNIQGTAASIVVETNFSLFVSYNDAGAVHITVPVSYSDKVCGMCGNFNHLRDDDYRTPGSSEAEDSATFGQNWQSEACDLTVVPIECQPTDEAEYASEPYCGSLISRHGPFSGCQSVLGAESYFRSCVAGMCGADGDPEVLCEALQSYSDMCLKAGVLVPAWRNSTMCPLECGANSHYNACAKGCPEVCSSMDNQGACGRCEERCVCDPGFKLSGGSCVPAEDCGCWIKGEHYERGETFMEGECDRVCQCMSGDRLQCAASSCAADEVCKVKEGVNGCFLSSPATCHVYGDPHYITFDGKAYTFQGGCSYTLAKTCGGHTPVQFSVTGQNWNPRNESSAKLGAVVLETSGLHVKMQNYSATVNHVWQHLPVTVNGTYGEVKLYKKKQYTVMETTFGLRMLLDDQSRLFLQLDERYKGKMCGLCGTYSDDQGDDFLTPNGTKPETNVVTFANSWRVNSPEDDRCVASPPAPQPCDSHLDEQGYRECSKMLREAFKHCHPFVHPTPYIDSCMSDHCASGGNMHVTCDSLRSYVTTCEVANVTLPPWWNDTACDSLPGPPTIPPVTTPDKELCPLDCNFDNSECGWEQIIQDSFDWRRLRGPTPSDLTGPTQDHTTGGGSYMYIEGDGVYHGDSARMMSPKCQNGPGQYCLRFWYHMYGQATAMALNVYQLDQHNGNKKLWSKANNQGSTWYPAEVDIIIDGSFKIIMEGIRGSDPRSDVAFDDVSIHYESCSGSSIGGISGASVPSSVDGGVAPHPVCNLDCAFEQDLCGFTQLMTDVFDWTRHSGSTPTAMTGPSADHTKGSPFGHYLYIEANSVSNGDTAHLLSSECSDPGPQCLQFWYHMSGSAETMGLHVYLLQGRYVDGVWGKRNNQGDSWQRAQVDLMTTETFQIIFEGHRGTTDQSDVTIDDVSLHRGRCADLIKPPTPTEKPKHQDQQLQDQKHQDQQLIDQKHQDQQLQDQKHQDQQLKDQKHQDQQLQDQKHQDQQLQDQKHQDQQLQDQKHQDQQLKDQKHQDQQLQDQKHQDQQLQDQKHQDQQLQDQKHPDQQLQDQKHQDQQLQDQKHEDQQLQDQKHQDQQLQNQKHQDQQLQDQKHQDQQLKDQKHQDQQLIDQKHQDQQLQDHEHQDQQLQDQKPPDQQLQDQKHQDQQLQDQKHQDQRLIDQKHPDQQLQDQKHQDQQLQDQKHQDQQLQDQKHQDQQLQDQKHQDQRLIDQKHPDQQLQDQKHPDQQLQDQKHRDQQLQDQKHQDQQLQDQKHQDQQLIDQKHQDQQLQDHNHLDQQQKDHKPYNQQLKDLDHQDQQLKDLDHQDQQLKDHDHQDQQLKDHDPQDQQLKDHDPQDQQLKDYDYLDQQQKDYDHQDQHLKDHKPYNQQLKDHDHQDQQLQDHNRPPQQDQNSHYISCISACQPTCKHLHGPPDCSADEPCVQGCVCDDGFVLKQRVCVPIQQCGCVGSNGNSHNFKENWYTEHCHQKCECDEGDGVGEIDCDDENGCDEDTVCFQNEAGQYFCKSTDFSECSINGEPEYRTFDNMKHDFEGRNSYILVQTTGLSKNQPDVYIEAIIEIVNQDGVDSHRDSRHGDSGHGDSNDEDDKHKDNKERDSNEDSHDHSKENDNRLRLRGLKIRVYNHTVEFRNNRKLVLDGRSTHAPVSPAGGLRILERSSRIYLKTDFGLSVEFDGDSRAEIILPHTYKRRVGGLCGNFDGKKKNDMTKPNSNQAKSIKEFRES
ncbi:uncharacterized protein ACWYII_018907 [Salvelinus alpinus]